MSGARTNGANFGAVGGEERAATPEWRWHRWNQGCRKYLSEPLVASRATSSFGRPAMMLNPQGNDTLMWILRHALPPELPPSRCTLEESSDVAVVQTYPLGNTCSRPHNPQRYGTWRRQRRWAKRRRCYR